MSVWQVEAMSVHDLPSGESERIEYKSGATPPQELRGKLLKAASGFWNSGGGMFVVGMDNHGNPDEGFPLRISRTPVSQWIDQCIASLQSRGEYRVRVLEEYESARGVIAVEFHPSHMAPHMADDNKYYVRVGEHTLPATQFLVEALWARRSVAAPVLVHVFRMKPENSQVIQLGVVASNAEPALNVHFDLSPLPTHFACSDSLPLDLPLIDRDHPFYIDLATWPTAEACFAPGCKLLLVAYPPKTDPLTIRVPTGHGLVQETLDDEADTTHTGTDHHQAA